MSKARGDIAENIAAKLLRGKKLKILETNYRSRWGEIDIIARENDILVFIEVRYRESNFYGSAPETVDYNKQQRIIKTALHFLATHSEFEKHAFRFDLIGMSGALNDPDIYWLQSAFTA